MSTRIASLYESKILRTIVGTTAVLVVLVRFTEMTLRTVAPIAFIFTVMIAHDTLEEAYDFPEGANWIFYGGSLVITGLYLNLVDLAPWVGGIVLLAGLWFVFDGATTIRYGASRTTHEYVSDLEDEMGETMLRMQTLNVVYQALKKASEPQETEELATDLDLTESRVERALGFLESEGRIEQIGNQYRVEPPRWGRVTPIVQFLVWFPRRVVRPFRQITAKV